MAVPAGIGRVRYIGAGSTGPFAFNFVLYSTSHLTVTKLDTNGVETTLTLTTDYTVTIAADFSSAAVTLIDALAGDGIDDGGSEILTITRDPPIQQLTQWPRNDPFPSLTHERAADLAVMMIGRLNEKIGRSLLLPETTTLSGLTIPLPLPGASLGWNLAGDNLTNVSVPNFYVQTSAPVAPIVLNSLWLDSDSALNDLYIWDGDSWNDTGINLKGVQGDVGPPGAVGTSGTISTDAMLAAASATTIKTTVTNYAGDLNSLASSVDQVSFLRVNVGATNAPTGALIQGSYVATFTWDANAAHQTYWEVASNRVWRRVKSGGVWDAWGTIGAGKQTIWIPAGAIHQEGSSTRGVINVSGAIVPYIAYGATADVFYYFNVAMPKSWNRGAITAQAIWAHPATTTNFAVVWQVGLACFSDDDAITNLYAAQSVTDTGGTTSDLYISDMTANISPGGTPAESDLMLGFVSRNGANVADTLAVDAYLIGIRLIYNTGSGTDD